MRSKHQKNQTITAASAIGVASILAGLFVYYDGQAPSYDYSFSRGDGQADELLTVDQFGKYDVNVFVKNSGQTSGIVTLTITAVDATFTDREGKETFPSIEFEKTSTKGEGWSGSGIFVKPNPSASTFTLFLSAQGKEFLSDVHPAIPVQLTYKYKSPGWYELQ